MSSISIVTFIVGGGCLLAPVLCVSFFHLCMCGQLAVDMWNCACDQERLSNASGFFKVVEQSTWFG